MSNVFNAVICIVIAFVATFIVTLILGFKDEDVKNEKKEEVKTATTVLNRTIQVASPLTGKVVALTQVKDEVFSKGIMGKGVAVIPSEGVVVANFNER